MSRRNSEFNQEHFHTQPKLFVLGRNKWTVSKVTSNVITMTSFRQSRSGSQNGFRLFYVTTTLMLRRNKVLSQLSGFPAKICLPSARIAYSEMCPIKGQHDGNRSVSEPEEDADCNSNVCKWTFCYFLSVVTAAKMRSRGTVCWGS
jgi:hypothetical protein